MTSPDPHAPVTVTARGAESSPLGRSVAYVGHYSPGLLHPMSRQSQRRALGLADGATLPFVGADLWSAYELSWLNPRGKPQLAIAHLTIPAESAFMVESKSLKLYLNSFSETVFDSPQTVQATLVRDLNAAVWQGQAVMSGVGVRLVLPDAFVGEQLGEPQGLCVDRLEVECTHPQPAPELLQAALDEAPVTERLFSRLLKSNCPVTGQPDWGCLEIGYSGPQIDQAGLLRYLVSFRQHPDFHEQCVERIFLDIRQRCRPARLWVHARYTRRGGIDISPWRSSHPMAAPSHQRTARQ